MEPHRKRRLFFALWPDETCRQRLLQSQRSLGLAGKQARYVPGANLHITLHFIGSVPRLELACLKEQSSQLRASAFSLTLDTFGHFKKPQVSWLGMSQLPAGLLDLHGALARQLKVCGFQAEKRHYNPHVTMVRKQITAPADLKAEPIDWRVNDFVLVESVSVRAGVRYDVLERYPLN